MSLFPLKNFQEEDRKYILQVQADMKIKKGVAQYSIASALHKIIKEHKEFKEKLLGQ